MATETHVELVVTSDVLQSGDITRILGVQPDRTWKPGDLRTPGATITHSNHGWLVCSSLSRAEKPEAHVRDVMTRIEGSEDNFTNLEASNIRVRCVIYCSESPETYYDSALLRQMCRIGADLDIDIYLINE